MGKNNEVVTISHKKSVIAKEDIRTLCKLKRLELGTTYSYSELCEVFSTKPTKSYISKQKQLEDWKRFCDIQLINKKYVLSNIKEFPEPQIDKSKLNKNIANMLYLYMYLHPDSKNAYGRMCLPYSSLYGILGYNNDNMKLGSEVYKEVVANNYGIFQEFNKDFYTYANQQIKRALHKLRDQRIIDATEGYQFLTDDGWEEVSDGKDSEKISMLLESEKEALGILSANNYENRMQKFTEEQIKYGKSYTFDKEPDYKELTVSSIMYNGLYSDFKEIVCQKLSERLGKRISSYRRCFIIYVQRNFLGIQLSRNLGKECFETAKTLYLNEKLVVNDIIYDRMNRRAAVKGAEIKKLADEIEFCKIVNNDEEGSFLKKEIWYNLEPYNNTLKNLQSKNMETTPENFETEYIEVFKDITDKLIKIYPDRF